MLTTFVAAAFMFALQAAPADQVADTADTATRLPTVETTGTPPAPEPERGRVVCRTETLVGSRMPQRRCISERQDDQLTRESRALAQRLDVQNSRTRPLASSTGRGAD